jgi:hypothetical protein
MVDLFLHLPVECGMERKPAVPSTGFYSMIATVKRLQTHVLGRTVTGIGLYIFYLLFDHPATIDSLL